MMHNKRFLCGFVITGISGWPRDTFQRAYSMID